MAKGISTNVGTDTTGSVEIIESEVIEPGTTTFSFTEVYDYNNLDGLTVYNNGVCMRQVAGTPANSQEYRPINNGVNSTDIEISAVPPANTIYKMLFFNSIVPAVGIDAFSIRGTDVQDVAPSDGEVLIYSNTNTRYEPGVISSGTSVQTARVWDAKFSGTNGGTFTAGSWQIRDLDNINDPNGIILSLSANRFTLGAGSYLIEAHCPAYDCDINRARLFNVTDSNVLAIGSNQRAPVNTSTNSVIQAPLVIASNKTFEVQHRCGTTKTNNGFGIAMSFGDNETYTTVSITKIG